jgi:hypothetical protein
LIVSKLLSVGRRLLLALAYPSIETFLVFHRLPV